MPFESKVLNWTIHPELSWQTDVPIWRSQLEYRVYNSAMISKGLLFTVLAVGPMTPMNLCASDTPATPNLLAVASGQAALWNDSGPPFVIDLDFTVLSGPPIQGHLRLRWKAKDQWWSRVSMGRFEQVKIQKAESTYALRNADFTPRQLSDLLNFLHVGTAYDKLVIRGDKQRTEGGIHLDCLDAQHPDSPGIRGARLSDWRNEKPRIKS